MSNSLKGWLIVALLVSTAVYAIAEEITLTTYYPSPRGVYQELKTAGDLVVGDITNSPAARLHVVGSGTAPALRVDDVPGDTSPVLVDAAGNVGIGTTSPDPSALLDLSATNRGLLPPRMTTSQRDAMGSPAPGLVIYNTDFNWLQFYDGMGWRGFTQRVVSGKVALTGAVLSGSGFTSTMPVFGRYQITFDSPFSVPPTVVVSLIWGGGAPRYTTVDNITTGSFEVNIWDDNHTSKSTVPFTFIALEE